MFNPLNLLTKLIKSSNQRDIDKIQKTPYYIYSQAKISDSYNKLKDAVDSKIYFAVFPFTLAYIGTEIFPLIIIAKSVIIQCAQFLDRIAIFEFLGKLKLLI